MLCPSLDSPDNGYVSVTSTFVGDRANYHCNSGYRQSGSSSRRCQLSGEWSGIQPTCISEQKAILTCHKIQSSLRTPILNFLVIADYLQYTFYTGTCSILIYYDDLYHGYVSVTTLDVGGRATYTCNSGFRLVGLSNRTCLSNGSWSGSAPICNCMLLYNP